jgi:hypothetical protein
VTGKRDTHRARQSLLVATACLVLSCRDRPHAEVVARLSELHGTAAREMAGKPAQWDGVAVGAPFSIGDAVRTSEGATAKVEIVGGGVVELRERTTVRFLVRGGHPRSLAVETGEAEVEAGDAGTEIETSIGMAELEPGSRVHLSRDSSHLTFDVLIGGAQLDEAADGSATRSVKAGQRLLVSIGGAGLEQVEALPRGDAAAADVRSDSGPARDSATDAAVLGVVAEVHGAGAKVSPTHAGPRIALAEGTTSVAEGSRIVVSADTTVELTRGDEHVTLQAGSDVDVGASNAPLVRVATGRVLIKSKRPGTRINVPGGTIELVDTGRGDVQADVRVEHRTAHVTSNHAELALHGTVHTATVGQGQSGTVDARGEASVDAVSPKTADIVVDAGESATIHSPTGAASTRIRIASCPGDSLVEITSHGTVSRLFVGSDDASTGNVRLGAGSHPYSITCDDPSGDGATQRGTLTVLADSGMAHLARTAAANSIDADGRHYHVLYQSLLPQMTLRWPGAPSTGPATLHTVAPGGGEKSYPAVNGAVALAAGAMGEGTHRFWFEVNGHPDRKSPETSLLIGFDNAAPAAEMREPADGQPLAATIHVSGVAGAGSSVSVSGVSIPLDAQLRFSANVPGPPPENPILAVKITHPAHGIHYYLRRLSAAHLGKPE